MSGSTSHWGLPWPSGTDDIAEGDDEIKLLAEALDNHVKFGSGTFVNRGTASSRKSGFIYYSTDVPQIDLSDGTNWRTLCFLPATGSGPNNLGPLSGFDTGGSGDFFYSKDPAGNVSFYVYQGTVDPSTITQNTLLGTLPSGYRPQVVGYGFAIDHASGAVVPLEIDSLGRINNRAELLVGHTYAITGTFRTFP